MKNCIWLMVLCSVLGVRPASPESQFVIIIERPSEYEGNSTLYNLYDSSLNGIKGGCFATIAVPCTFGLYIPYAFYKFADLCYKKTCLLTSNAATFNSYTRQELECEASLRELSNRGAKAFVALLYLMVLMAAAGAAR